MKKIFIIFAAMAAVLSSCQKSELESVSVNDGKDIVLNISVSNPGADTDTKVLIKTGWAKDDRIKIWYDSNIGETPDLVIKYDGYDWEKDLSTTVSGKNPSTGENKYIKAVYNNYVIVASKDDYTFEENTLTFNIKHWVFLTEIQVVVKGITYDYNATYKLKCDKFTPTTGTGFTVGADGITANNGTEGNPAKGMPNADGVAFVFATAKYSTSFEDKKDFTFTLTDDSTGEDVTKTYKVNTAIEAKSDKSSINALTIASSKFTAPAPDGFVDLGVVVNSKPLYWAEKNLGAANPEGYGNLYSWGNVDGQSGDSFSSEFSLDNYKSTEGYKINNSDYPWDKTKHDAAYKVNNSWRMPTTEDFKELAKQCFLEWTENYNSTGVKGLIVWKAKTNDAGWFKNKDGKGRKIKDDGSDYNAAEDHTFSNTYTIGTDSYVFFPAAGYSENASRSSGGSNGSYWSSTYSEGGALYLDFGASNVAPQSKFSNFYGFSVRPVSD